MVDDLEQWKLVLSKASRLEIIREYHDTPQAGHGGVEKTYRRVAMRHYWPRMFRDVASYVRLCDKHSAFGRSVLLLDWSSIPKRF